MWNKGDWVVVIGGTFDRDGKIRDVSFQIASIIEIGLDDLNSYPSLGNFIDTSGGSLSFNPINIRYPRTPANK